MSTMESMPQAEARAIYTSGIPIGIPAHWAMIHQGTPADAVYLILSGTVTVRKNGQDVATLGPGSFVGELAHEKQSLRSATVVSENALTTLRFSRESWENLKATCPALREAVENLATARSSA